MRLVRVIVAEAWHRRLTSVLTVFAVSVAVAAVVFVVTMARASENETRVIQRDAGLNVRIIPSDEPIDRYWSRGWAESTMPESYIDAVSGQDVANRLIPMLQRGLDLGGAEAVLTGIAGERFIDGKKKAVYGMEIEPGRVRVGSAVAERLGVSRGDTAELLGERFVVDEVLFQTGSSEDARVYASLGDVQRLLGLEGRLSEIQALECHCSDDDPDPLATLAAQLEPLLPGTRVIRQESLADARMRQRSTAKRFAEMSTPVIVLLCASWVGALAMINVRDRRTEWGLLSAVGYGVGSIGGVVIGRAALLGVVGAVGGYGLGAALSETIGPVVFRVTAASVETDWSLLWWSLGLAPVLAAVAGLIPAVIGATQDPSGALRME